MQFVNKYKSLNYDLRSSNSEIKYIIIHYTAMDDYKEAISFLTNKKNRVSSHFLISKLGTVYNLVDMKYRAWHAGFSFWKNERDINSYSVGIELDNCGKNNETNQYSLKQISSLVMLIKYIKKKYKIDHNSILGHSDIAPYRKIDPGKNFPWNILYNNKIINLPNLASKIDSLKIESYLDSIPLKTKKIKALHMLGVIGYNAKPAYKNNLKYNTLIKSYQMHFLSNNVNGKLDLLTYEKLKDHYNNILTK